MLTGLVRSSLRIQEVNNTVRVILRTEAKKCRRRRRRRKKKRRRRYISFIIFLGLQIRRTEYESRVIHGVGHHSWLGNVYVGQSMLSMTTVTDVSVDYMGNERRRLLQYRSFNSGHDGTKASSLASVHDVHKRISAPAASSRHDQCTSGSDVTKHTPRMTCPSAQPNEWRGDSFGKPQTQISAEKEALNSPKPSKSRKDQFCKVFPDIAETDEVIKSYHCAFFRDILLQGFLYITPNWFCFYSKLLGKKSIKIPVSIVTNITKKKTAIIIPNAIRVITDKDKYVFGSLMSRDNTYELMLNVWQEKRKVLQPSVIEEQIGFDVDAADRDSAVNVANNNKSNGSSKDDFVVSSDGSFCSDLESTSQSIDRLLNSESSSVPTNQKTSLDVTKDGCQPVFRIPAASHLGAGTALEKPTIQCIQSKNPFASLNDLVTWILNFPRTCLFLTISTVLVLFLLLSAILLACKLIKLQVQLATFVDWSSRVNSAEVSSEMYREMLQETYISRHDFHISNIEKIHTILESHVEVLSKVNKVLKELQTWAVTSCFSSITPAVDKS